MAILHPMKTFVICSCAGGWDYRSGERTNDSDHPRDAPEVGGCSGRDGCRRNGQLGYLQRRSKAAKAVEIRMSVFQDPANTLNRARPSCAR